ncbi:hypothetical protein F5Y03DRAFT_390608 [Xylaria venustula]|nr:hypothetical protein F5Y03DRAFT_390608 [Xylaria venustula]
MSRKRVERSDSQLSTGEMRLTPKSPSPLPGGYLGAGEGQSAATLTAAVLSPPHPLPLPFQTTTYGNNNGPVWGGSSRWNLAMSLGSPTSWDQHQHDQFTRTSPGFSTQGKDQYSLSASNTVPGFPTITNDIAATGHSGNDSLSGNDVPAPDDNPLAKWQVPTQNADLLPSPLAILHHHPSISYTDIQPQPHTRTQPVDSIAPFAPASDMVDYNNGFTGAGFGGTSTSFRDHYVDLPGTLTFPHEQPHDSEHASETTIKYPVAHYHSEHVPNLDRYVGQDQYHLFSNREPWYEEETPGPSLAPITAAQFSPPSRPWPINKVKFEGSPGQPSTTSGRSTLNPHKVAAGGKKAERPRRPRGQLLPKEREETSNTRKRKACIRCRMQKIRCIPDPSKPETECCQGCRKVLLLETKKVIHRIPCLRWNLNEVVLFRVGGLGFTKRWTGVSVENIHHCDWVDERVVTIGMRITALHCDPLPLKVRRFRPNSTDVQHRYWKHKETEPPILVAVPAYALADVDAASQEYRWFVGQHAEEAVRRFTRDTTVNDYVRWTFSVALSHSARAANKGFDKTKGDPAKLFRNYFRLWLASRFTIGSAYIANGQENLEGKAYPPMYHGKHFIPRMITAQFDSIGYKHVLAKLKREVLDELWLLMQKRTAATFFPVYLIVFMMLHEMSVACQDRRRRAREQGLNTYYDLEDVAAKIKHGADIILGHWHYFRGDFDPTSINKGSVDTTFGDDYPEEVGLLRATCRKFEDMRDNPRNEMSWEQDPLQLSARMFEQNWQPFGSCWP